MINWATVTFMFGYCYGHKMYVTYYNTQYNASLGGNSTKTFNYVYTMHRQHTKYCIFGAFGFPHLTHIKHEEA